MKLHRFMDALAARSDIDPASRFHFAFLGATLGSDAEAFVASLPEAPDTLRGWNAALVSLVGERLERLREATGEDSPTMGFLFAGSYRHQLLPLARGLAERGHRVVGILDHREWRPGSENDLAPYLELPAVSLLDPSMASMLGWLGIVFAPDTAWRLLEHLPKNVKRAALQHGLTAAVDYSIAYEGGGTTFDHLLLTEAMEEFPEDMLKGIFPRSLVRHGSDRLAFVPAGWPKLDEMIRAFTESGGRPGRKVVIHLSVQDHDSVEGMKLLPEAIEGMLSWEPPVEILFRPFPGVSYPFAESIMERFGGRPGFRVSSAESYVQDYKDASALVTLKETTAEIFPLATGIPSLCLIPERAPGPFQRGWICGDLDDLLGRVRVQLDFPWRDRERIFAERDRIYCHVGRSLDALSESVPAILSGSVLPGWICAPLFDGRGMDDEQEHIAALERLSMQPRYAVREYDVQVVRSALERHPGSPAVLLAASKCLLRIARRHQCMRMGQRLAAHHLCFAELFLLLVGALEAVRRCLPRETAALEDGIRALEQDALQMCLVLEWAETHVPGYAFVQNDVVRGFILRQGVSSEEMLAAIGSYVKPHPNLPIEPRTLVGGVLERVVERAVSLLQAGAVERAECVFTELPGVGRDPRILNARLELILSPGRESSAPGELLAMLRVAPDLAPVWKALGVSLAEHRWTGDDESGLKGILPRVFDEDERLATLWIAAREGGNIGAQTAIVDFLESCADVPRSLVEDLRGSFVGPASLRMGEGGSGQ